MKKLLSIICLFISVCGVAQEKLSKEDQEKLDKSLSMLFESKIDMAIDNSVFPVNEGNTYFTDGQDAGIIAMVAPQTYAKMKAKMNEDTKRKNEIVDKGEIELDGQKVLFMKSTKKKDDKEVAVLVYCKENDSESCLMVTCFFEKDKEETYKPHAEKAITTAKLVK